MLGEKVRIPGICGGELAFLGKISETKTNKGRVIEKKSQRKSTLCRAGR